MGHFLRKEYIPMSKFKTNNEWLHLEMCHAHYAVHYVMRIMRIMRIMQNPCNLYNTPVINKNHNISISINPTDIKHISSESSR